VIGDKTVRAIKKYQRANGLTVDGVIGEITYAHMQYPFRKPGVRDPDTQRPVLVCVNVEVNKLFAVNDSSGQFSVDFTMYVSWEDENFEEVVEKNSARFEDEIQWERHWKPDLTFTNDVAITSKEDRGMSVYKDA
jgi:hypothetical protein